jgi:carbon storage regulator
MLCLSRKVGERIVINQPVGDPIVITVVEIDRNKIRIGIIAPEANEILREELVPLHQRPAPHVPKPRNPPAAMKPAPNYGRNLVGRA